MSSSAPAFVLKLWKLVEDQNVDDLISWSKVCGNGHGLGRRKWPRQISRTFRYYFILCGDLKR